MSRLLFRAVPAALLAATCLSSAAMAQNLPAQQADAAAEADQGETIIVTGSRIARADLDAPSPVQVIGAAQIAQAGVTNIQELLLTPRAGSTSPNSMAKFVSRSFRSGPSSTS